MGDLVLTTYDWVPPPPRGYVRDLRVRWALEEAGLPYEERLIGPADQKSESYRRRQPFGQVPAFEEDGFVLFETGAIVLHIGERCEALLPKDPAARARATQWLIAALNSVEAASQPWVLFRFMGIADGKASGFFDDFLAKRAPR